MCSVECIKRKSSTVFKPPSKNRRNMGGQAGCQIISFYHPSFQWNWSCTLIHCHCGDTANFVLLIWRLLCLELFHEHGEDEQEMNWKKQYWNITIGSFICMIEELIGWFAWDICVSNLDLFSCTSFDDLGCGWLNAIICSVNKSHYTSVQWNQWHRNY